MIFFEEIKPIHLRLIQGYLLKREKIYFLRVNKNCYTKQWFEKCIAAGYLKKSTISFELGFADGFYHDKAFDNVEIFYQGYLNSAILKRVKKLYNNSKSDLAFKKVLNQGLARFYYLNFIFKEIEKTYSDKRIIFIPSNGVEVYRTEGCDIYDYCKFYRQASQRGADHFKVNAVKFPLWATAISYSNAFRRKFILIRKIAALPVWLLFKCIKNFGKNWQPKQHYDYAVTIISPLRQFANKVQKVDFLVDGDCIRKKQVVFVAPKGMTEANKRYFIKNKLNFIDDVTQFISFKRIAKILPVYFSLLFLSFKVDSFIGETGLKGIYFYAIWKSFTQQIAIKKLITYCDYEIKSVFRNIILEQSLCVTYLYMDSTNLGCFSVKKNSNAKFRHHFFGFLYYTWFISWNDQVSDYFQQSFSQFKHHVNLGCFWAEHLRLIKEGVLTSHIKTRLYEKGYRDGMKLVSAFDSTFYDESRTPYDDGIEFLKGLYALVEKFPDMFLILKEKNSRSYHETISVKHKEINALYKKLDNHPRCYLTGKKGNSSEVIAFSDLTISFPLTSTTYEAISARKKAVWYDASNKFKDTYYDSIQGLICHNYKELLIRVRELLFETSEDEYNNYLDTHVKGRVESYLDGKAITRFRGLLSGSSAISIEFLNKRAQQGFPNDTAVFMKRTREV